ncbi:MAG TPA: DUF2207 domain-containing protein [Actinomycetota bacterium]|nr:DUF2207 domain-containing protein [Actinomycetota bacterium]
MRVTVSSSGLGWSAMGFVTLMIGIFVASDVLLQGATGSALFFAGGIVPERLFIAAGATGVWLAFMGIYRLTHQVRRPPTGRLTQDIPEEPPALANMLANGFDPTPEAVSATVVDLAARGVIEIVEVGNDRFEVRLGGMPPPSLLPFERRVYDLLASKTVGGVVAAEALTTGRDRQARAWWKAFRREVAEAAQARGLSRNLWQGPVIGISAMLGIAAGAVAWWALREWMAALWYGFFVATVIGVVVDGRRQRDTPAGYRRAGEILGFRRFLREGAFEDLPPTAVAVWERHLAYATALGVGRRTLRAIPMGADDDHRAWSAMSGEWREVRIRYPRWWPPGWGRMPTVSLLFGLLLGGLSAAALYGLGSWLYPELAEVLPAESLRWVRMGAVVLAVIVGIVGLRALAALVVSATDLGSASSRTGTVLRIRSFGREGRERHYVAVDDGRSERIRAFRIPTKLRWVPVTEGKHATASFSPRLGYLRDLRPAPQPESAKVPTGS